MGISEITILNTEKTERKNLNIDKLRKQAVAASKQSLRFFFPKINDVTKLSDFIKNNNFLDIKYINQITPLLLDSY